MDIWHVGLFRSLKVLRTSLITIAGILLIPVSAYAQTFSDPLTAPLSSADWAIGQNTNGLYTSSTSSNGLLFQKVGTKKNGFESIYANLKLNAIGGINAGNFDTIVHFTGAIIGPHLYDQIQLNTVYADGSVFFGVYDNSLNNGTLNVHVWNSPTFTGSLHGATPVNGNSGEMEIRRVDGSLSFLFNGNTIFTESKSSPLTALSFSLQNNGVTNDNISVTFQDFSFTAHPSSVPAPDSIITMGLGFGFLLSLQCLRRRVK